MGSSWEEKWYDVNLINRTYSKKVKKKTVFTSVYYYSTLISFPLGFDLSFLLNVISSIPLLYFDFAVARSASSGSSIVS